MAETWIEIEKVREHIRKCTRKQQYFQRECLMLAAQELQTFSEQTWLFGLIKRKPISFSRAWEIVAFLHNSGSSCPRWCTKPWPNDLNAYEMGTMPDWELKSLDDLCDQAESTKIRITHPEWCLLTGYKNIPILDEEKYNKFVEIDDLDEFERREREKAETLLRQQQNESSEKQNDESDSRLNMSATVQCNPLIIVPLITMVYFLTVFFLKLIRMYN